MKENLKTIAERQRDTTCIQMYDLKYSISMFCERNIQFRDL